MCMRKMTCEVYLSTTSGTRTASYSWFTDQLWCSESSCSFHLSLLLRFFFTTQWILRTQLMCCQMCAAERNADVIRSGSVVVLPARILVVLDSLRCWSWYPWECCPLRICRVWLHAHFHGCARMVHCLPLASHRAVDLRHHGLEPIYSAHYQEADVWALLHAHFVEKSLHDELCNVDLLGFYRCVMREKTMEDGPRTQKFAPDPSCSSVSSSFTTDDQCGFSSCLSAHCWLTHLLHHYFRVNTSCLCCCRRWDKISCCWLLRKHHLCDRNLHK